MQIHYFYKHLSEEEKQLFDRYIAQKVAKLTALVQRFEPVDCEVTIERFAKKKAYKVAFNVKTTHGSFFASEDDHTIAEAVDLAKHKLVRQFEKAHDRAKPNM